MIRAGLEYVCARDFRCLNREFEKGKVFPVRRYHRLAASLKRQGKIVPRSEFVTVSLLGEPGEGPFKPKHRGGGRFALVNAEGETITNYGKKDEVQKLADKMNATPDQE